MGRYPTLCILIHGGAFQSMDYDPLRSTFSHQVRLLEDVFMNGYHSNVTPVVYKNHIT